MEKISQLMDGELEGRECILQLDRLKQNGDLAQSWSTYHLIRDVLRDEAGVNIGIAQRVHQRLASEPIVIAPHTRVVARVVRYSLPMAATVAGVAVVGWLALSLNSNGFLGGGSPSRPVPEMAKSKAPAPSANGQMNDYLLAHQEFSPSSELQGLAPYIRTVSNRESESAR
jgi:sigma-E factor negative regulatory protein RseA